MEPIPFSVRPIDGEDRDWVVSLVREWGADFIVTRGEKLFPADLPGLCAVSGDGERLGLVTYRVVGYECQVVTLHARVSRIGIGTGLLEAVRGAAVDAGCRRMWVTTTNDNLDALRFYQRRDMELVAVHRELRDVARRLKPSIPLIGEYGIRIRDELELEMRLDSVPALGLGSGGTDRPPPSAAIFDMDGVLLDSDDAWESVMEGLFAQCGRSWSGFDQDAFNGGDNSRQWASYLRRVGGLPLNEDEIVHRVVGGLTARLEADLPLVPGAVEAVARLAARYPLGLASSSPRAIIEFVLRRSGLDRFFRVWVSSDDVASGKPAPDVYLEACRLLGLPPERCVAVEDSRVGIQAAKAAGLKVVGVPHPSSPPGSDAMALADRRLASIDLLDAGVLEELYQGR